MMRGKVIILLTLVLTCCLSGCTRYEDPEDMGGLFENGAGFIKMISQSDNPYEIYIDDVLQGCIQGHNSKTYTVEANVEHVVEVKQQTGYLLWPTTETYRITVGIAQTYTKNFPVSSMGKSGEGE